MNIKLKKTIQRLREFNEWRRGDNKNESYLSDYSPKEIGKDLDFVLDYCEVKLQKEEKK